MTVAEKIKLYLVEHKIKQSVVSDKTGINKEPFIKLGRKSKVIRHTISAPFPNTNINFLSNLSDK